MIKWVLDIVLSLTGLLVLSPFFILTALLVKIYDFGPVIFVQDRIGRGRQTFRMFKFRTMVVDAEKIGAQITVSGDSRITPLGKLLRATKADELPQLWNVLKGEMSFVGPRPEVKKYVDLYSQEQARVLDLVPGITDLASYAFFNESEILAAAPDADKFYRENLIPAKIKINLEYAARATPLTDLILIFATVLRAFGLRKDIFRLETTHGQ